MVPRAEPGKHGALKEVVCFRKEKVPSFPSELGFQRASGIGSTEENSSDASLHSAR
jgi:hypothetical protein